MSKEWVIGDMHGEAFGAPQGPKSPRPTQPPVKEPKPEVMKKHDKQDGKQQRPKGGGNL